MDTNLEAITKAARKLGYRVFVNNNELCDLVVQYCADYPDIGDITELWEVKTRTGKFTQAQLDMRAAGWQIRTVRTLDDIP